MSRGAEERLAAGDPRGALAELQERVRARPADAAARVFLFQLLAVLGEWRRAGNQLDVAAELDAGTLLMAQTYRELLRAEVFREAVFDGRHPPLVAGEPPAWLASLVQALPRAAAGDGEAAATAVTDAFERAEARPARLGVVASGERGGDADRAEVAVDWIGDADMRLGPVLEAVLDGKYHWVPLERLASVTFEPPTDLRDLVWLPATFGWIGGGETVGFVPSRYPRTGEGATPGASAAGSGSAPDAERDATAGGRSDDVDGACLMARRTEWRDLGGGFFTGRGQRVLASADADHALLEIRSIAFDARH